MDISVKIKIRDGLELELSQQELRELYSALGSLMPNKKEVDLADFWIKNNRDKYIGDRTVPMRPYSLRYNGFNPGTITAEIKDSVSELLSK